MGNSEGGSCCTADFNVAGFVCRLGRFAGLLDPIPDWSTTHLLSFARVFKNGGDISAELSGNSLARPVDIRNCRIKIKWVVTHRQPFPLGYK